MISATFNEENSKYEGRPLIEPRIPYYYEVKLYKPDKNAGRI